MTWKKTVTPIISGPLLMSGPGGVVSMVDGERQELKKEPSRKLLTQLDRGPAVKRWIWWSMSTDSARSRHCPTYMCLAGTHSGVTGIGWAHHPHSRPFSYPTSHRMLSLSTQIFARPCSTGVPRRTIPAVIRLCGALQLPLAVYTGATTCLERFRYALEVASYYAFYGALPV